jgi:hypothetical protein
VFNLPPGCVFVLTVDKDIRLLEFTYPIQLKGNMIPIDSKSIAGRAVMSRRSYISNNVPGERGFISFDWLMARGSAPVQKMITYPVIFTEKVIAVLQVVRKGTSPSQSGPDFQKEDIEKIKSILDDILTLRVVKSD